MRRRCGRQGVAVATKGRMIAENNQAATAIAAAYATALNDRFMEGRAPLFASGDSQLHAFDHVAHEAAAVPVRLNRLRFAIGVGAARFQRERPG